jgi:hypothetical protein
MKASGTESESGVDLRAICPLRTGTRYLADMASFKPGWTQEGGWFSFIRIFTGQGSSISFRSNSGKN